MTVKDIYDYLDTLAPFSLAEEWDNSGLTVGDFSQTVTHVTVALDATEEAVLRASHNGSELLVTHHPMIFNKLSAVPTHSPVYKAVAAGLSAIGFHTCYDNAAGGVNDILAKVLGLSDVKTVEGTPFMRVGTLEFTSGDALAKHVEAVLGGHVRYCTSEKPVARIAVVGGAGEDYIREAASAGADAYVTGEGSHHDFLLAKELSLTYIAAGHYETENPAAMVLYNNIKEHFPELSVSFFDCGSPVKH